MKNELLTTSTSHIYFEFQIKFDQSKTIFKFYDLELFPFLFIYYWNPPTRSCYNRSLSIDPCYQRRSRRGITTKESSFAICSALKTLVSSATNDAYPYATTEIRQPKFWIKLYTCIKTLAINLFVI